MNRNRHTTWLRSIFAVIALVLTAAGLFNYVVDPLWCFSHSFSLGDGQASYNERLQKTNRVTFGEFDYDSLILGSSRTTYLDQKDFAGMHAYNYSAASMEPTEYAAYIEYAKQRKGSGFRNIVIGMDFFGTNEALKDDAERPEAYFTEANSFLYRYRMLLTMDTLRVSLSDLTRKEDRTYSPYHRDNTRSPMRLTQAEKAEMIRRQLERYHADVYTGYRYREDLPALLKDLLSQNPKTSFIVYTTPVSRPLFCLMIQDRLWDSYARWLHDLVDAFGSVHNFMYLNSVTNEYANTFQDAHHLYPAVGTLLAHKVTGLDDDRIPSDFGVVVNRTNIDMHLAEVKRLASACPERESARMH